MFDIALFDSGVGSYSIVKSLQKHMPKANILYFADKAHFPYGLKSKSELKSIMENSLEYLAKTYHPKVIIMASNTPSLQVLSEIRFSQIPVVGVFPPLEQALEKTHSHHIAILATKGSVESPEIQSFIAQKTERSGGFVHLCNASPLVDLVESGDFLNDIPKSKWVIKNTIEAFLQQFPLVDVMTLSSTHLPFLQSLLEEIFPYILFLDPAEDIAKTLFQNIGEGSGTGMLHIVASQDAEYLENILTKLGAVEKVKAME